MSTKWRYQWKKQITDVEEGQYLESEYRKHGDRLLRRRESLFSVEEMAEVMGVDTSVVLSLEESFLTTEQRKYLAVLRYSVGVYPIRRRRVREVMDNGEVAIVSSRAPGKQTE